MQVPLKISFHNMAASESIEARVRERVARLERLADGIVSCRVSIEAPHKQPHRSTVGITIDIGVPGKEIVVKREQRHHESRDDAYQVINVAFDVAERQLEEHRDVLRREVKTHEGAVYALDFSPDARRLAFSINSATSPSDVYSIEFGGAGAPAKLVRWTESEVGGLDSSAFVAPRLVRFPTFDRDGDKPRTIPAFYYRPVAAAPGRKLPVVINIHGGPEGQARPVFSAETQFLANELGIAVLVPNVRGSSGYGKTWLKLDNGRLREDSVRDIGALLDWIATQPDLDAGRVAVYGGSYGGYMVLASMTRYNERLRAGVDIVGISNFVTFLENTQDYRRDLRRSEYGDERNPEIRTFLERIAPLTMADAISVPMFVVQGGNDPRVPLGEAEQMVARIRDNGTEVWYLMARDEGHGFARKPNRDFQFYATVMFLREKVLE